MSSAVLDYWDQRLENWALWVCSGGSTLRVSSAYRGRRVCDDDAPPRLPPPLLGEAFDTNELVLRLAPEHQRALTAAYIWTGTLQDRARSLGCSVSTLHNRMRQAKFRLDDLYHARRGRVTGKRPQRAPTTA